MKRNLLALLVAATLMPATLRAADDKAVDDGAADRIRLELFAAGSVGDRPALLTALYGTLAGLQVYDGYSTIAGLRSGARETNVMLGGLAARPAVFWGVKAASTGISIYLAERLWRSHRRSQAIAVMVASNAVMSLVAARNASVLKASR